MYQVFRQCVAQSLYPHQRARCKTLLAETRHEKNRGFGARKALKFACVRQKRFFKGAVAKCKAFCNSPFLPS